MKLIKCIVMAMIFMVMIPQQAKAKQIVVPKSYMFGFVANFTDSVVYFTDIQTVDSVWYNDKNKFLLGRSQYANQLRTYFTNTLNKPHSTCIVISALTRKDAEKKYLKLKKKYTGKYAGKYDVRNLNENEFHFTSINMTFEEEEQQAPPTPPQKQKKQKKQKK